VLTIHSDSTDFFVAEGIGMWVEDLNGFFANLALAETIGSKLMSKVPHETANHLGTSDQRRRASVVTFRAIDVCRVTRLRAMRRLD
jgi:hypothetical protein